MAFANDKVREIGTPTLAPTVASGVIGGTLASLC